ncbi:hypothetical protein J2S04_002251 [Alicyclobacillus tengchongensis]|uniref:Uncharacterized protein n=2 Tax=Alicyclobacillus tolerans TaxID=90970 RepID=A0ABT9LYE5_9BACL|nr:hypothetical protein [Alicyclobacillus tengchongensis]SHK08700.1 hypothetical protein SAMN05443507_10866 [Alicyclobacillus montanus]
MVVARLRLDFPIGVFMVDESEKHRMNIFENSTASKRAKAPFFYAYPSRELSESVAIQLFLSYGRIS